MTNQEWLSSISPAECYKVMNWLLNVHGKQFTSTEVAVTQWLEGDAPGDIEQLMIYKTLFHLEYDTAIAEIRRLYKKCIDESGGESE